MDREAYAEALRREGAALLEAAGTGPLDAAVPGCPGWTMADVVRHTGEVHRFWAQVVGRRLQSPEGAERSPLPPDDELLAWFGEGLARLANTLAAADPAQEVWTWSTDGTAAFVQRRMAQETAVHRVDVEAAAGRMHPIEAGLAADGIDEFLATMLPFGSAPDAGPLDVVLLRATDAGEDREWRVGGPPDRPPDATVTAPASDLLLLLWRRLGPASVKVEGDHFALTCFLARTELE